MSQQAAGAAITAPNQLVISFKKRYNFCRQFCERSETAAQLKEILRQLIGQPVQLTFVLLDDEPCAAIDTAPQMTQRQRLNQACQRPFVRKAIELFDANPARLESAN
jgi:ABC-type hemin transport system ATPase subunit